MICYSQSEITVQTLVTNHNTHPPLLRDLLLQLQGFALGLDLGGFPHKLVGHGLAGGEPGLHVGAGLAHALHVPVHIVQGLLDALKRIQEVIRDLEVSSLYLSPEVSPVLEVVLLEESGELLEGVHGVLVALQLGVQDLLELPGEDGVSFRFITDILRHPDLCNKDR